MLAIFLIATGLHLLPWSLLYASCSRHHLSSYPLGILSCRVSFQGPYFVLGSWFRLIAAISKLLLISAVQYKSWRLYPYKSHRILNYVSCFSFPSSTLPTALLKQCMRHTVKSFHDLISCSMMTSRASCSIPFLSGSQVLKAAKIDAFHIDSVTK